MGVSANGAESVLTSLIAFDADAKVALMRLHRGDALAVIGQARLTSWTGKDGEIKRGLGITAESVISIYEVRKRKSVPAEARTEEAMLV